MRKDNLLNYRDTLCTAVNESTLQNLTSKVGEHKTTNFNREKERVRFQRATLLSLPLTH